MHFAKFHTVSQMQTNIEIMTQLVSKNAPLVKATRQESRSPNVHSRGQSTFLSPQRAFAINLQPTQLEAESAQADRLSCKNPQTPKIRKAEAFSKLTPKSFAGVKGRKTSGSSAAEDTEQGLKKYELFSSDNLKNFIRTPKDTPNLKQRKSSCNLDFTALFKKGRKNSQNNSGPQKKNKRQLAMKKKMSMGWDQNNNFKFSTNLNSDEAVQEEVVAQETVCLEVPKLHNLRKQSQNESPKRQCPSFLNNFKNHRNSIDTLDPAKRNSRFNIHNFGILRQLGKGTFGRVVLAVERETRMMFAIKIISKREIREGNMIQQLIRELKIQQSANHPNIIKVYGFFDDLLHFYIIMECALDGQLSQYIKKRTTPATDPQAATTINQICSAVSYLHSQSTIHRDLKPDNILFHEGVVKITDFGWSVRRDGRLRTTFCGTPVYLCPQILIGDQYDESVDIWTIGVILYEIYCKMNPFRITCKEELINIINQPIYFDEKIEMCSAAKDFIQMCLKKRAVQRPNIRELLLHQFLSKAVKVEEIKR